MLKYDNRYDAEWNIKQIINYINSKEEKEELKQHKQKRRLDESFTFKKDVEVDLSELSVDENGNVVPKEQVEKKADKLKEAKEYFDKCYGDVENISNIPLGDYIHSCQLYEQAIDQTIKEKDKGFELLEKLHFYLATNYNDEISIGHPYINFTIEKLKELKQLRQLKQEKLDDDVIECLKDIAENIIYGSWKNMAEKLLKHFGVNI